VRGADQLLDGELEYQHLRLRVGYRLPQAISNNLLQFEYLIPICYCQGAEFDILRSSHVWMAVKTIWLAFQEIDEYDQRLDAK